MSAFKQPNRLKYIFRWMDVCCIFAFVEYEKILQCKCIGCAKVYTHLTVLGFSTVSFINLLCMSGFTVTSLSHNFI